MMMMKMSMTANNALMVEQLGLLAEKGVMVQMRSRFEYEVFGFYKSNSVVVNLPMQTVTARYGEVDEFADEGLFDALVELNYSWWSRSHARYDGWARPAPEWEKLFEAAGLEVD